MIICPLASVEEVFETEHGGVYQCSRKNCYWLEFKETTTSFKVNDFLLFKKRIDQIDIENMLSNSGRTFDFEIIMPFRSERCFVLNVHEILQLKEVLAGAKFMIELNSQVKQCLLRGRVSVLS
ncbi:DUF6686 family protein [Sphingobacterium hungaricum]|uniref:Uncharacterized protein n=1 Tax=Sphingobacterium hungaricum TaxID=2082723 RepID=A0A928YRP2_9SPHI|nr:DUF6686 family protein [Sphingobacterium hungaricum]MBE8715184.1 hypothetical protein [Sphingobacterium hungaricum]